MLRASLATFSLLASLSSADEHATLHNLFTDIKNDVEPMIARVTGKIPDWVKAERYNNGFGRFGGHRADGSEWGFDYLFDVMPYTNYWKIADGEVTFACKLVQSNMFNLSSHEAVPFRTFGPITPPRTQQENAQVLTHWLSDNYNVNIIPLRDKYLIISDMAGQAEVDGDTLQWLGPFNFHDAMDEVEAVITTAHPSQLPGDPFVYNYHAVMYGNEPSFIPHKYQIWRIDTSKEPLQREIVMEIPMTGFVFMHQFAHTKNYIVFVEYPLVWDLPKIGFGTTILPGMNWKPEKGTFIRVINKNTWTVVKTFTTDPFFAYHHLNAYEEGHEVVVDILTTPCNNSLGAASCDHMNSFQLKTLRNNSFMVPNRGPLRRFRLPVTKKEEGFEAVQAPLEAVQGAPTEAVQGAPKDWVGYEDLNQLGLDLQAIHPLYKGQKHNFVWALGGHGEGTWWNNIIKLDIKANKTMEWYVEDHYPSEIGFLPRPGGTAEDDGLIISTILGSDLGYSYLLFLDAATLEEVARADAPLMLPFLSHGHTCSTVNGQSMCYWA